MKLKFFFFCKNHLLKMLKLNNKKYIILMYIYKLIIVVIININIIKYILLNKRFLINIHFIKNPNKGGNPMFDKININKFNLNNKLILKNFNWLI